MDCNARLSTLVQSSEIPLVPRFLKLPAIEAISIPSHPIGKCLPIQAATHTVILF